MMGNIVLHGGGDDGGGWDDERILRRGWCAEEGDEVPLISRVKWPLYTQSKS